MEINVNGTLYPLKASIAFLNEIEKTKVRTIDGEKIEIGLANAVISIRDMVDVRVLIDTIMALNIRQTPRLNKDELTEWFEEGEVDLEKLGSEVIDFLSKANVCRWKLKKLGILETAKADPEKA
ncbi:tail assembly chaperone [Allobaculum fili]|uniref:tail assembly chaperone n=1 Tax=Allobaculum fili TaxID=2834460 RepID=UPI001E3FF2B1|nr:tail assembly chaperone [Allobaculum fili]